MDLTKLEKMDETERNSIVEKMMRIDLLSVKVNDPMVRQFFDFESLKLLDEKIEVLTALSEGKPPKEIPNYLKVLELLPKGEHWDL